MEDETWKDIPNYMGLYQVSNIGRVRSLDREVKKGSHSKKLKGKVLKPGLDKGGYLFVGLCKDGKQKSNKVHRLAAEAFVPNPESKRAVNHINGIKTDNRPDNLEWCTNQENIQHAYDTGLKENTRKRVSESLSKPVIDTLTGESFKSAKDAAEVRDVNYNTLRNYLNGASPNKTNLKYFI